MDEYDITARTAVMEMAERQTQELVRQLLVGVQGKPTHDVVLGLTDRLFVAVGIVSAAIGKVSVFLEDHGDSDDGGREVFAHKDGTRLTCDDQLLRVITSAYAQGREQAEANGAFG